MASKKVTAPKKAPAKAPKKSPPKSSPKKVSSGVAPEKEPPATQDGVMQKVQESEVASNLVGNATSTNEPKAFASWLASSEAVELTVPSSAPVVKSPTPEITPYPPITGVDPADKELRMQIIVCIGPRDAPHLGGELWRAAHGERGYAIQQSLVALHQNQSTGSVEV